MAAGPSDPSYPRPDFQRTSLLWRSLNGTWDFFFDDQDAGLRQGWHQQGLPKRWNGQSKQEIIVPYAFQASASGVRDRNAHAVVWYERIIDAFQVKDHHRLLLHFGAVDYQATVWINGHYVGSHFGGHTPFELDITDEANDVEFRITLRVFDSPTDKTQPRGKQYWGARPEGIFYTPSTGIWQSVWLESVPGTRIANSSHGTRLKADDIDNGNLGCEISIVGTSKDHSVRLVASLANCAVSSIIVKTGEDSVARTCVNLRLPASQQSLLSSSFQALYPLSDAACWRNGLGLWSPEHPLLYDLIIQLVDESGTQVDEVRTSVGMRAIDISRGDGTFRLNNQPIFQALVLDQGYWPETGITPPTSESLKRDILLAKAMGFNGCRKHQKLEDPRFLFWADRLGFLVWSEMANAFDYSGKYVERFDREWHEAVRRDINHPSVVVWTPVNESWGYDNLKNNVSQQNHIRSLYFMIKTLDSTRPVNDNCGWEHVCTDLTTFHDYSEAEALSQTCDGLTGILAPKADHDMFVGPATHQQGTPIICTEFGGVNIAPKQGEDGIAGAWGYTTAADADDLLERVRKLMLAIVRGGLCCGFVYTQLTDIEQEVNGLYTFNRTAKLPASEVKKIIDEARSIYMDSLLGRVEIVSQD